MLSALGDPWEFWPELNLFEKLGPTTRLYFVGAYAEGKESEFRTLDLAGYFDLTLGPPVRRKLRTEDWRAKKYFWVRIGYDHVFKAEGETKSAPEDRGIVAFHGRAYLPGEILFEGRARADLRWIDGDYSTRYRLRGELNREFDVIEVRDQRPYLQAEGFYDTRYDGMGPGALPGWSRGHPLHSTSGLSRPWRGKWTGSPRRSGLLGYRDRRPLVLLRQRQGAGDVWAGGSGSRRKRQTVASAARGSVTRRMSSPLRAVLYEARDPGVAAAI